MKKCARRCKVRQALQSAPGAAKCARRCGSLAELAFRRTCNAIPSGAIWIYRPADNDCRHFSDHGLGDDSPRWGSLDPLKSFCFALNFPVYQATPFIRGIEELLLL
jgi:hypothetical protein